MTEDELKETIDAARNSIRELFTGVQGQEVLNYLVDSYVEPSAFDTNNPESTFYRLGQKELVQDIVRAVNSNPNETIGVLTND